MYAQRQATVSEHTEKIRQYTGYRSLGDQERLLLQSFLQHEVEHLEQTSALLAKGAQFLRSNNILLPADWTLRRIITLERTAHRDRLFDRVMNLLDVVIRQKLDGLLVAHDDASPLNTLKASPGISSPRALIQEASKLTVIEDLGILEIDLSWIRGSLRKALSRRIWHSDIHRIRELKAPHRYSALSCFLQELHAQTIDVIIDMHGKLMTQTYGRAKNKLDEKMRLHRKSLMGTLESFSTITRLVLSEEIEDLRQAVFREIPPPFLEQQLIEAQEWLTGSRSDVFPFVKKRYGYLRRFAPVLLQHINFESDHTELTDAIELLHQLNEEGKRKLPAEAPRNFLPKRARSFIETEKGLDRLVMNVLY